MMETMARICDQGMGGTSLPTTNFLQLCMAKVRHGEMEFPPEWQLVVADSNFSGPPDIQSNYGLREDSVGFCFMENTVGLEDKDVNEPTTEHRDEVLSLSEDSHAFYCSFNLSNHSQGHSTTAHSRKFKASAGHKGTHKNRALVAKKQLKSMKDTERVQRVSTKDEGKTEIWPLRDSTEGKKALKKKRNKLKLGAVVKKWQHPRKKSSTRRTVQFEEIEDIAGSTISDVDIHN